MSMPRPNYRVLLSYDAERKVYIARVPELAHCQAEGATRSEAITQLEGELDALMQNLAERGTRPPEAIDEQPVSGDLAVKISRSLQRELTFQAQLDGIEISQLVSELLAGGLESRQRGRRRRPGNEAAQSEERGPRPEAARREARSETDEDAQPASLNERGEREGRFEGRGRRGGNYNHGGASRFQGYLEDRASFIEYVRQVEQEGNRPRNEGRFTGGRGDGGGRPGPRQHERGGRRDERPNRENRGDRDNRPRSGGPSGGASGKPTTSSHDPDTTG